MRPAVGAQVLHLRKALGLLGQHAAHFLLVLAGARLAARWRPGARLRVVLEALGELVGQVQQQMEAVSDPLGLRRTSLPRLAANRGAIPHNDAH